MALQQNPPALLKTLTKSYVDPSEAPKQPLQHPKQPYFRISV